MGFDPFAAVGDALDFLGGGSGSGPPPSRLVSQAEKDRLLAQFDASGGKSVTGDVFIGMNDTEVKSRLAQIRKAYGDSLMTGPPPPPDLLDQTVQRARAAMVRRLLGMQGIGSTFLTGSMGLPDAAPTQKPGLTGA